MSFFDTDVMMFYVHDVVVRVGREAYEECRLGICHVYSASGILPGPLRRRAAGHDSSTCQSCPCLFIVAAAFEREHSNH